MIDLLRSRRWLDHWSDYQIEHEYFVDDPALYQADGVAVVWTVAHEGDTFILLTEAEAETWRRSGWSLARKFPAAPPVPLTEFS